MFFLYNKQLHNVTLAIDLMRDSGMKFYAKPEGNALFVAINTATLSHIWSTYEENSKFLNLRSLGMFCSRSYIGERSARVQFLPPTGS